MNKKNIYWNYREETATVKWLDDHTLMINKHKLNVETDTYDFRKTKEKGPTVISWPSILLFKRNFHLYNLRPTSKSKRWSPKSEA